MSTVRAINQLADVICRAQKNGRVTPAGIAVAVDAAGMLMSPETAAELEQLRGMRDELAASGLQGRSVAEGMAAELERLRARVAELETAAAEARPIEDEPIRYVLTDPQPDAVS